ncbi:MAG: chloride channel protein [Firmicutes bacterium]|nr:chloride channel protein [Bacillota bacterium]
MAVNAKVKETFGLYLSKTAHIRDNFKKWFLFSFIVGVVIGLAVAGVHFVIYDIIWFHVRGFAGNGILWFVLPAFGILAAAVLVNKFSVNPWIHSTEEIIQAYHEDNGRIKLASFPAKVAASVLTIGFGGSAGMEGPSIYIGSSIASWLKRTFARSSFTDEDTRWMILAGGAAGIAAIFKAPLTGIVFGLEVPYKDDLAHNAFIPSLIASVTSYIVFVSMIGTAPLFKVPHVFALNNRDLLLSIILGIVCGLTARLFVFLFHWSGSFLKRVTGNFVQRAVLGSTVMGIVGVASLTIFKAPFALGSGYEAINSTLAGKIAAWQLLVLFLLKVVGTSATLAAGGVGGIFIPMIVMGATIGGALGGLVSARGPLYPILGMAAFLGAGYSTPLAAATFVAETTGSPGFIIPGLIAAAVSYTVSGRRSVSAHQRFHRQTVLHRIMERRVEEAMTSDVVTVPANISIEEFVHEYVLKYRHKSFPVVNDHNLYGMVGICDIKRIPTCDWRVAQVGSVAVRDVVTAYPDQNLAEVSELMSRLDIDRLPVVNPAHPKKIVGVIASTDIVRLEELSELTEI